MLHSFDYRRDGDFPYGGLILDGAGNLYGTLSAGGAHRAGAAFKLTPASGGWTETILHSFCSAQQCIDGSGPFSGLTADPTGNLYGATFGGGRYGDGTLLNWCPAPTAGQKMSSTASAPSRHCGRRRRPLRWTGLGQPRQSLRHERVRRQGFPAMGNCFRAETQL